MTGARAPVARRGTACSRARRSPRRARRADSAASIRRLKAMDDAGRVRRGYFVTGLGATQFALPGALDLLRSLREAAGSNRTRSRSPRRIPPIRTGRRSPWPLPKLTRVRRRDGHPGRRRHGRLPAARAAARSSLNLPEDGAVRSRTRARRRAPNRRLRDAATPAARARCYIATIDDEPAADHPFGAVSRSSRARPRRTRLPPALGQRDHRALKPMSTPEAAAEVSSERRRRCLKATPSSAPRGRSTARWPDATVTTFDTQLSQLAVVDRRAPIAGRTIVECHRARQASPDGAFRRSGPAHAHAHARAAGTSTGRASAGARRGATPGS